MKLDDFVGGWFIGDFEPSLFRSKDFEICVKRYRAGDSEPKHVHRVATEYTVVVSGDIKMNGVHHAAGSIIEIKPGEATDFMAITDAINVVVKIPCVVGDKYVI